MPPIDCRIKWNQPLMQDNSSPRIMKKTRILLSKCRNFDLQLLDKYETNQNPTMLVACRRHPLLPHAVHLPRKCLAAAVQSIRQRFHGFNNALLRHFWSAIGIFDVKMSHLAFPSIPLMKRNRSIYKMLHVLE